MQLIKAVTFFVLAAAGVSASRGGRPTRPPPSPTFQKITCSSGDAYCCAPSEAMGTTCSKLAGSSVSCNSLIVCCNNNNGVSNSSTTSISQGINTLTPISHRANTALPTWLSPSSSSMSKRLSRKHLFSIHHSLASISSYFETVGRMGLLERSLLHSQNGKGMVKGWLQ